MRRLLAAGVPVEARDEMQRTALHHALSHCNVEVVRDLMVEHNANMLAVDENVETPFDMATQVFSADGKLALLVESYSNKLTQEHGRLALHSIVGTAEYSFVEEWGFHAPLNPLQILLPLGKLTLDHFRMLLNFLDAELIRNRDDSGKLPIHKACQANAPVAFISILAETEPTTLHFADYSGSLPIHSLCEGGKPAENGSVQYLVEQGGVGTLAARNRDGALPLHVLCGSSNPSLRTVQYLVQSFPGSVKAQMNSGQYPFMVAASETSTASLSVIYELVRANPRLASHN